MQNVDLIGVDSVAKCIQTSKLTKFIISRPGSGKGSIPVFECIESDQNAKAVQAFKDWAEMILRMNTYNATAYEILLYSKNSALDEEEETATPEGRSKAKSNKIKFTFSLNAASYGGGMNGGVNVGEEIRKALSEFKRDQEIENLRRENEMLRNRSQEEDDEEEEDEDHIGKVTELLKLVKSGAFDKKKVAAAKISGEDEIPDPDEDDEEESETNESDSVEAKREAATLKLKTSLKTLRKSGFTLDDISKMARLSKEKPKLFNSLLTNLRSMF